MSNKTLVLIIIAIIIVGAAVGGYFYWQQTKPLRMETMNQPPQNQDMNQQANNASAATPTAIPTSAPSPTASAACVRDFDASKLAANANININNREVQINVQNFGVIDLEFYPSDAPKAVENFLRLADSGYYDCLTFHRIAQGFVIQGGDPNGNGTGGESAYGAPFADELNPATASYKAGYLHGVLAMANSGPNTNGSQFFIMLADNSLPHLYTIFGKVTSGLDVVDQIGKVAITPVNGPTDGSPVTPVVMTSVKIIK